MLSKNHPLLGRIGRVKLGEAGAQTLVEEAAELAQEANRRNRIALIAGALAAGGSTVHDFINTYESAEAALSDVGPTSIPTAALGMAVGGTVGAGLASKLDEPLGRLLLGKLSPNNRAVGGHIMSALLGGGLATAGSSLGSDIAVELRDEIDPPTIRDRAADAAFRLLRG